MRVRRLAVERLASEPSLAPEALRGAAADADAGIAATAVRALVRQGVTADLDVPFGRVLLARALDPSDRALLARALGRPGASSSLSVLGHAVRDDSPILRRAAAEAIARVGGSEAALALAELADSNDLSVVATAAGALDAAGDPRALPAWIRIAEEGRGAPARRARERVEADPRMKDVGYLLELLRSGRTSLLKLAAEFLLGSTDDRVVEPLLSALDRSDSLAQAVILRSLGRFARQDARVRDRLVAAVDDGDLSVRQEAVRILGEAAIAEAVPRLTAALANVFLRPAATEALKRIGDRRGLLAVQRRRLRDRELARQFERIAGSQTGGPGPVPEHPILRRARRGRSR